METCKQEENDNWNISFVHMLWNAQQAVSLLNWEDAAAAE